MAKFRSAAAAVAFTLAVGAWCAAPLSAKADTSVSWGDTMNATYDLSVPGTILEYPNEWNQGGLELSTDTMVTDAGSTDIAINNGHIGARSVEDLGAVDFNSVDSVPDSGYSTDAALTTGHVYIVETHDSKFAKVAVKSILGSSVLLTYAIEDTSGSSGSGGSGGSGGSSSGGGSGQGASYTFPAGTPVDITWDADQGAVNYLLWRSDNGGDYTKLTDFSITDTSFTDKYTLPGHAYDYVVESLDASGNVITQYDPIHVVIQDAASSSESVVLTIGSKKAQVNGKDETLDVAPILKDGRTLVPIRFLTEALGAKVGWDDADQSVTVNLNGIAMKLWIGSSKATVDGNEVDMDVPPQVIHDRTMVPIRFVSENLNLQISFNSADMSVTITPKDASGGTSSDGSGTSSDGGSGSSSGSGSGSGGSGGSSSGQSTDLGFFTGTTWNLVQAIYGDGGLPVGTLQINTDGTYLWNDTYQGPYSGTWVNDNGTIVLKNFDYTHDQDMTVQQYKSTEIQIVSVNPNSIGADSYVGTPAQ